MMLRPYQQDAMSAIRRSFDENASALVVMATGLGKTVLFSHVIADRADLGRSMVIAHRDELLRQAADKISVVTGSTPDIEKADQWADRGWWESNCVVSSIQTQQNRMTRFKPRDFATLVIDEAHHATASSYRKMIRHYQTNPDLRMLGVTATPDRADEEALGQVFDDAPFVYDLPDAVRDGWLVPIRQFTAEVSDLDFSTLRTRGDADFTEEQVAALMETEAVLHEVAGGLLASAVGPTIVFCASVHHAERLAEIINRPGNRPGSARWLCGKTLPEERRHLLHEFNAGSYQFLCNVGVLTEGFDSPVVRTVAVARPTKSRSLYAQMIGRGTRPLPEAGIDQHPGASAQDRRGMILGSAKPAVKVIDFHGNAGQHKLVSTADILGGNYSDDVVERARAKASKGREVDMADALEEAKQEIHAEAERRREEERRKRQHLTARAKVKFVEVDPFDVLHIEPAKVRGWDRNKYVTEKQKALLVRNGMEVPENMTRQHAAQLIGAVFDRRDRHLCTFKQARWLEKFGYDASNMTFSEASALLDQHFKGGGKRREQAHASSD